MIEEATSMAITFSKFFEEICSGHNEKGNAKLEVLFKLHLMDIMFKYKYSIENCTSSSDASFNQFKTINE